MPPSKDPYDFSDVPDESAPERATPYTDEWQNYKDLTYILLSRGVDINEIGEITDRAPIVTTEDLASVNATLFQLADRAQIPREWLMKQLERKKRTRSAQVSDTGGVNKMSWLSKKADGPEMEHQLPTKSRPNLGGPTDGPEGPGAGAGAPGEMPPMGGGPKPPMGGPKPPMGGPKPPMGPGGPKAPGGKPPMGLDEVKMMLEKGDLQGAMDALKKLLPGGGDKSSAPPHKAPNLGKPAPKPGKPEDKGEKGDPAKPAPKSAPEEGEEKKDDKPEAKASLASLYECGNCGIVLDLTASGLVTEGE